MIQFYQERFLEALTLLAQVEIELQSILAGAKRKKLESSPGAEHLQRAKFALDLIEEQCRLVELRTPGELAAKIRKGLHANSKFFASPSVKEVLAQLTLLRTSIASELPHRLFMCVPHAKAEYWQISGPFPRTSLPPDVNAIRWEIDEAGRCYVAGRSTASVFHAMRAAEIELHILSKHLGVPLRRPIEFEDWRPILAGIENKLELLQGAKRGPEKAVNVEFYSDIASHLRYFKDIWRDNTAHARKRYNESEALGVINRVTEFTTLLLGRLMHEAT